MSEADDDRQLTIGELARAIERGSIRSVVRGAQYEITWREVNRLRLGLAGADLWLLFQSGGGIEIRPGGEDISQAI
jgi:hypothetical protein